MTQEAAPELPRQVLDEKLGSVPRAKESFDELCRECDPDTVSFLCYWIMPHEPVTLPMPDTLPKRESETRSSPTVIHNRPLDSWETAADSLKLEDLRRIAEEAEQLWTQILRLRRTPLVTTLIQMGELPRSSDDLLGGLPGCGDPFSGLRELPNMAKKCFGPRHRPDYTRLLTTLCKHVCEKTGSWHDSEIQNILNALLPNPPGDLKQWRYDHGLTCLHRAE